MKKPVKALVFDVYGTLFDVFSVKELCEELFPEKGEAISQSWRKKQLEYSFLRQLMGNYIPFIDITKDSLRYAVKEQGETITYKEEQMLMEEYLRLSSYPEVPLVLEQIQEKQLAVFSNGSHDMLDTLIKGSSFGSLFDHIISVDEIKQYKPTPASYDHVLDTLGISRDEVLFMSSNGWDISGAKHFGFNTAWINRNHLPVEELNLAPDAIYDDLRGILEWV